MNKIIDFLKEVKVELTKVNWPTRHQTIQYTIVVISLSLALAIFLGGLDFVFQWILTNFIVK